MDLANSRVRRLIGMTVENRDGAKLGVVRDFVVDFYTGKISYAILSSAGILGLRAQLTAVPPQALSTATVKARTLAIDIGKIRWGEAPRFKKKELQHLGDRTQEVLIYQFYNLPVPSSTTTHGGPARPKGELQFATAVMGDKLIDRDNQSIGSVSDLLLNLAEERPVMAIVVNSKKQTYAAPLRSISLAGKDRLKLDATPAMFAQAQMLTPKAWQLSGARENTIYRYE